MGFLFDRPYRPAPPGCKRPLDGDETPPRTLVRSRTPAAEDDAGDEPAPRILGQRRCRPRPRLVWINPDPPKG